MQWNPQLLFSLYLDCTLYLPPYLDVPWHTVVSNLSFLTGTKLSREVGSSVVVISSIHQHIIIKAKLYNIDYQVFYVSEPTNRTY